jgi:uncharacterized protein YhaN
VRVSGWFVDGFGVLSGFETRGLPAGLVVFEGANEAGKSTLLAFLRGVLFGFPRATKGKRPHYPPLAGGRHGGRVFLQTASGEVTVEREVGRDARITVGDGSELSDAEFQRLIGGVDAQTFKTVFAFSLDELSDFTSLTGEQVRSRIFAAGVGGAGPSVRQVIQELEKITGQLLKPRSLDAEINRLLDELAGRERELAEARLLSDGYPQLLEEEEMARVGLLQLDERERDLRAGVTRHERLLDLWPVWVDLESDRSKLASLESIDDFLPEARQRLAEAKQALEGTHRALTRLEEQKLHKSAELARLRGESQPVLIELGPAVERQIGLLPLYRDRLSECEQARTLVRLGEERLRRVLSELGPATDETALADIDTSLPRIEQMRGWRSRLTDANDQLKQATERMDAEVALHRRTLLERDRQKSATDLMDAPDGAELAAHVLTLRTLRAGLAEVGAKRAALEARESTFDAMARLVEKGAPGVTGWQNPRVPLAGALVAAAVMAAGVVASLVVGMMALGAACGLLLVVTAAAAVTLFVRARRFRRIPTHPDALRSLEAERAEQEQLRDSIVRIESALGEPAAILGWDRLPGPGDLEQLDASLGEKAQRLSRWEGQMAELARTEERLQALVVEEDEAQLRLERARDQALALERESRERLSGWGLPPALSWEGAEEYLRAAATAKDSSLRLDDDRAGLARIEAEIADWEAETGRLLQRAAMSVPADQQEKSGADAALLSLGDLCSCEADRQRDLVNLQKSMSELETDIERQSAEVAEWRERWDSLLAQAAASDEAAFLRNLAVYEERGELRRRIGETEGTLIKRIGLGAEAEALRRTLETGKVDVWKERVREAGAQLEDLREEGARLIKLQGDTERRRRDLEESADVPGLETTVEGLRTDLDSAVRRWRVNTLAVALIRDTLAKFTRERQPLVLAEASRMFALVTGGRYQRVVRSPDEEGIIVIDADGRLKSPEDLSRGAAEQLYLCLRLGLAEEFSRRAEPIPLVMDDVLVNFDPARRRATGRLLLEFAQRHQILLFTCHPEIEDLFLVEEPGTCVVRMS